MIKRIVNSIRRDIMPEYPIEKTKCKPRECGFDCLGKCPHKDLKPIIFNGSWMAKTDGCQGCGTCAKECPKGAI
jgi:ferredoxin